MPVHAGKPAPARRLSCVQPRWKHCRAASSNAPKLLHFPSATGLPPRPAIHRCPPPATRQLATPQLASRCRRMPHVIRASCRTATEARTSVCPRWKPPEPSDRKLPTEGPDPIRSALASERIGRRAAAGEQGRAMSDSDRRGGGGGGENPNTGVVVKARPKTRKPAMYKVLMLNDDYTPMEFVVHVLERFFQKNRDEATKIMLHVHRRGVGVCGVYTYEVAETKVTQVMDLARQNQHPLQCTIEKE